MNEEMKEAVLQLLVETLTIDVVTTSEYTGGMGGGDLYKNCHKIQLCLEGQVISEVYLD